MDRCAERYGEIFTLRVRRRPWVLLSNPQHVKQVVHDGQRTAARWRGRSQPAARAAAGVALGDAAGRAAAHGRPQATAAVVSRPADEGLRRDDGRGRARADRALADRRAVRAVAAHAGDQPGGRDALGLRRHRRARVAGAARAPGGDDRMDQQAAAAGAAGGVRIALDHRQRRVSRGDAARSRRSCSKRCASAARGRPPGDGDDIFWMLERSHDAERRAGERGEDARRTRDDALRRPDGDLAGLGLRAPAAPPGQARSACARRCCGGERGVPRRRSSRRRCACARPCRW